MKMSFKVGMSLALSAWLTASLGCRTVGPDYHGPPQSAVVNAPAAQRPFVSASGPAFSPEPAPGAWWRLYDSPQLDELWRLGVSGSSVGSDSRMHSLAVILL